MDARRVDWSVGSLPVAPAVLVLGIPSQWSGGWYRRAPSSAMRLTTNTGAAERTRPDVVAILMSGTVGPSHPRAMSQTTPAITTAPPRLRLRADSGLPRIVHRRRRWRPGAELYAWLVTMTWPKLLGVFVAVYLLVTAVFSRLYLLLPEGSITNVRAGSSLDGFAFSLQTISTIGYGTMAPVSAWAHVLVTAEALCGVLGVAVTTGIVFAKFSLPRSNFIWSKHCVISTWNGGPHLMVRVVNARNSEMIEARTRLIGVLGVQTKTGKSVRRIVDLELTRQEHPLLYGGLILFHPLDEKSPLHGWALSDWIANDVVLIATIAGIESTYAQTVHARKSWLAEDVRFDHVFADAMNFRDDGSLEIDHSQMHVTHPEEAEGAVVAKA